jgi:peptidoglycan/LPS O-acetylase OafA/YrhL
MKIRKRFPTLDSLRGIAAINIVLFHFFSSFLFQHNKYLSGYLFVDLFFIISGFVLSYSFDFRSARDVIKFIILRFFRMYPLFLLSIIFSLLLNNKSYSSEIVLFNILFLQGIGILNSHDLNGPAWSLSSEFFTNIIWGLSFLVFGSFNKYILFCLFLLCLFLLKSNFGFGNDVVYNKIYLSNLYQVGSGGFVRTISGFIIGIFLNYVYRNFANIINKIFLDLKVEYSTSFLLLISLILFSHNLYELGLGWIVAYFLFPIFILNALVVNTLIYKILSFRFFIYIGSISYSIYVIHMPLFSFLMNNIPLGFERMRFFCACFFIFYFVILILSSLILEKFFVNPIYLLSKRVLNFKSSN